MAELRFAGESFTMAERIGLMPLMRFAKVAKQGVDSGDLDGLAAMYDLLEQCIAPADWQRFQDAADRDRTDGEALMKVVTDVFGALSERPTSRPSDSSDGSTNTTPSSVADSSSQVARRLEEQRRPDLALIVTETLAARSA